MRRLVSSEAAIASSGLVYKAVSLATSVHRNDEPRLFSLELAEIHVRCQ